MESFFNISVSYREDANVKNPYGLVERLKTSGENLSDIIDRFGANNKELANKTPQEVAKVLVDKWITNFGLPSIIISDLGSEYVADLHKELMNKLGIDRRFTTPRNPACNSAAETRNPHIIRYIKAMLEQHSQDWPSLLPYMTLAWNNGIQKGTLHSPHQLVFNTKPRTPFSDPNLSERQYYGDNYDTYVMKRLQQAQQLALAQKHRFQQLYSQ